MKTARISMESLTRQQCDDIRNACNQSDYFTPEDGVLTESEYQSIIAMQSRQDCDKTRRKEELESEYMYHVSCAINRPNTIG